MAFALPSFLLRQAGPQDHRKILRGRNREARALHLCILRGGDRSASNRRGLDDHRQARHPQLTALLLRDGCRRTLLAYAASEVPTSVPEAALFDGWAVRNRRADRERGDAGASRTNW